jgi:hypothetical protein
MRIFSFQLEQGISSLPITVIIQQFFLITLKKRISIYFIFFVLLSYALGAEEIRPHHRAGYPKIEGKDKQHTI